MNTGTTIIINFFVAFGVTFFLASCAQILDLDDFEVVPESDTETLDILDTGIRLNFETELPSESDVRPDTLPDTNVQYDSETEKDSVTGLDTDSVITIDTDTYIITGTVVDEYRCTENYQSPPKTCSDMVCAQLDTPSGADGWLVSFVECALTECPPGDDYDYTVISKCSQ